MQTKAQPNSSHFSSGIVSFWIGPKRRLSQVHHSLICSASNHFRTQLRRARDRNSITDEYLSDHDAEAFSLLVTYLYRGSFPDLIPPSPKEWEDRVSCTDQRHGPDVDKLLKLCFMAMKWDIPALHNHAIDHLVRYLNKSRRRLLLPEIEAIAANVKKTSDPLRCFAIDEVVFFTRACLDPQQREMCTDHLIERVSVSHINKVPLNLVRDVLKGALKPTMPTDPLKAPLCTYHRHDGGERCP